MNNGHGRARTDLPATAELDPYPQTRSRRFCPGFAQRASENLRILGGRMLIMPKPYPAEFRRNVVAVARRNEALIPGS